MKSSALREIALPAGALIELRESLREETDPLAAIHALHGAGYACADEVWKMLTQRGDPMDGDTGSFWHTLAEHFAKRGWGRLRHEELHPAIGRLTSPDWAEATDGEDGRPACAFSAGLISGVLSRAAGNGVAVLETSCRSRGDDACHFCYGSEEAIHQLYGLLLDGHSLDEALERL